MAASMIKKISIKPQAPQPNGEWDKSDPYCYSIGDVECRKAPDIKTGKEKEFIFALTKWPKANEKTNMKSINDRLADKLEKQKSSKPNPDHEEKKEDKQKKKKEKKKKEPKPCRKIFVSFKVKRVSDIDNVEEEFRIKFHMYFNWLPTYEEYMTYYQRKTNPKDDDDGISNWKPNWFPHIEFMNKIEATDPFPRWEEYPDEGAFRVQKLKGFFDLLCDDKNIYDPNDRLIPINSRIPVREFNANDAYFIRAKYDIEMLLSEELELQSFPFDCQDLSVVMREQTRDINISFLPEMRKKEFAKVDPRYSVIDEWDMESARIELGTTNAGASRSSTAYPMIILRLKMRRRYQVFLWKIVLLMLFLEILALTSFSLDIIEEGSDRLGLSLVLILTAVAFLHVVKSGLPNVPYLTFLDIYVLSGYIFLVAIMIETAIGKKFALPEIYDTVFKWICIGYQIIYHILFAIFSVYVRRKEYLKLIMDSDEIADEVNLTRPILEFDYTKGQRQGTDKRLLFFKATQRKED